MARTTLIERARQLDLPRPASRNAVEQLFTASGQIAAGAGNLLFLLVAARLLAPKAFAHLAAFLALYLLLHVFTGSLGAAGALRPDRALASRARLWRVGVGASLLLVLTSVPASALLGLPEGLVLALAVVLPVAAIVPHERGRLYALGAHRRVVASLLAEPVVRLTIGIGLALVGGLRGAASGVALGAWAAVAMVFVPSGRSSTHPGSDRLAVLRGGGGADADGNGRAGLPSGRTGAAVLSFLLLAVLLNQDLVLANRLLPDGEAARFAVLSTLGGVAAFATTTVPFVLLGQAGRRHTLTPALGMAAGLGIGAVGIVLLAPHAIVGLVFGARYSGVGSLAVLYVGAMAVFGIARVLAADLSTGRWRGAVPVTVGAAVLAQGILVGTVARTAGAVALVTLGATAGLTLLLGAMRLSGSLVCWLPGRREEGPVPPPIGESEILWDRAPANGPVVVPTEAVPRSTLLARARAALPTAIERVGSSTAAVGSELHEGLSRAAAGVRAKAGDRTVRLVAGLTGLGLALRMGVTRSIWLDEAIAISQARLPFGEMLQRVRFEDVHPPLHHIALWISTRVVGTGELAVRLPSIVAGTLLIPLLYVVGRELYGRRTGLVAATLGSVAPFLVWYSQEARMYAFFALFGLAAVLGQVRVLRRGRPGDWALYGAATAALLWTQYFAVLQVLAQQLVFVAAAWRRRREEASLRRLLLGWAVTLAVVGLVLVPLLPILRDQLIAYGNRGAGLEAVPARAGSTVDPAQRSLSVYAVAANLVWAIWGYHSDATMAQVVALWPLGMLLAFFLLGRGRSARTPVLLAVAFGPILAVLGLGLLRRDLFELRYFTGAVPALVLLVSRVITAGGRARTLQRAFVLLLVGTLALGLVDQQVNGANPRLYDFRGALAAAERRTDGAGIVLYDPPYLRPVVEYYGSGLESRPLRRGVPEGGPVVLLGSFLEKPAVAGRIGSTLAELRRERRLVDVVDRERVRVWIFE